jgi:hypothetical protein
MTVVRQMTELVLRGTQERINILVTDDAGVPITPTSLKLKIMDMGENVLIQDDIVAGMTIPTVGPTKIVTTGVGQYYWPFGDTTIAAANTSANSGNFLFQWQAIGPLGSEQASQLQLTKVASARVVSQIPVLRMQLDKLGKSVGTDVNDLNPCTLGYTDEQLLTWLEQGLTAINAAQPYPVWCRVDDFPFEIYGQILIDSSLLVGLTAQSLYAIDTDIDSYNDQGNSFNVTHFPKLMSSLQFLANKLDKSVPAMKRHFVNNGSVHVQMGPGFRLGALINSAPSGALFRNLFMALG